MKPLELPEEFKGRWENALIMTYGLDIPFFESALLSQFRSSCRNKIILADGEKYLEACANYAESGLVRHMNQRYLAEGIFCPQAAHAKLIMLTNAEEGCLLVGSGNLGLQGYASRGELFTRYEYNVEQQETLAAFRIAIQLVEGLGSRGFISDAAIRYFRRMLTATPWLYKSTDESWRPVRHNLLQSFIDQLVGEVGDEPVEELLILSPFYDEEAVALAELLERLKPAQCTLLVQDGVTSVKPEALRRVIDASTAQCQVRVFSGMEEPNEYFHAKLYLLKLADRAICLQGSPNLSQVAMRWPVAQGNVEIANLLTGVRDAFDYLFDSLQIEPEIGDLDTLALSFQKDPKERESEAAGWRLLSGEWHGDELTLRVKGKAPNLIGGFLNIGGQLFSMELVGQNERQLTVQVDDGVARLLQYPVPVKVQLSDAEDAFVSNPIFVCNRGSLDSYIEATDESDEKIAGVGGLDLDDEELEQLVGELEAHMVIDRRSVWQLASGRLPSTSEHADGAIRIDYSDIDYDMLRQHPKIRQYGASRQPRGAHSRSRLQIILSSITDHFQGLVDYSAGGSLPTVDKLLLEESEAQTEEEREQEETARQKRRKTREQRLRNIFKHFIRRYLWGLRSSDFRELVGHQVMADNYIIFAHLLWSLSKKEWFESEAKFLIESLLRTWGFFWGSEGQVGYCHSLPEEASAEVLVWVREHHADAQVLAALFHCALISKQKDFQELRLELRDFWRHLIHAESFPIQNEVIEDTWYYVSDLIPYEPPRPSTIFDELSKLAHFETAHHFLKTLEKERGYSSGTCDFKAVVVFRERYDDSVSVRCLIIQDENALETLSEAREVLKIWMQFQEMIVADTLGKAPDYYRIVSPSLSDSRRLLLYEVDDSEGLYLNRDDEEGVIEFGKVKPIRPEWDLALNELMQLAVRVDQSLSSLHPAYARASQTSA